MAARTTKTTTKVEPMMMDSTPMPQVQMIAPRAAAPYSMGSLFSTLRDNAGLLFIGLSIFIVGFLVGSIWTENKLLKNGTGVAALAPTAAPAAPGGAQPTTATVDVGAIPPRGKDSAQIAIVEFADLRCPFCKQFFTDTEPQIIKDYVDTGKAKFYFRNYAFLGPASTLAANAAECANEQKKFWEFYDYMYANQPSESDTSMYTNDNLAKIAGDLGIDKAKFTTCLTATKYADNITKDIADGNQAGGGSMGTPSFVIGKVGADGKVSGALLVGAQPYATFQQTLDAIK